jgi:hypothetical protein
MDNYPLLNRCAVIVTPKQRFWQWVKKVSDGFDNNMVFEVADSNIYLVPDYEFETNVELAIENYISQIYQHIFVRELEAWNTDPLNFPEITYDRFQRWFTVSSHTVIFDTVNEPLEKE